jgi:hypothetical protein
VEGFHPHPDLVEWWPARRRELGPPRFELTVHPAVLALDGAPLEGERRRLVTWWA